MCRWGIHAVALSSTWGSCSLCSGGLHLLGRGPPRQESGLLYSEMPSSCLDGPARTEVGWHCLSGSFRLLPGTGLPIPPGAKLPAPTLQTSRVFGAVLCQGRKQEPCMRVPELPLCVLAGLQVLGHGGEQLDLERTVGRRQDVGEKTGGLAGHACPSSPPRCGWPGIPGQRRGQRWNWARKGKSRAWESHREVPENLPLQFPLPALMPMPGQNDGPRPCLCLVGRMGVFHRRSCGTAVRTGWPCHLADGSGLSSSDTTHSTSRVLWVRPQAGSGGPFTLQSVGCGYLQAQLGQDLWPSSCSRRWDSGPVGFWTKGRSITMQWRPASKQETWP